MGGAVGVATWNVVGWGCEWGLVGGRLVVDETLGASRQPGSALNGERKRRRGGWGGKGGRLVVDETLGASCQPGSALNGGAKALAGQLGWPPGS